MKNVQVIRKDYKMTKKKINTCKECVFHETKVEPASQYVGRIRNVDTYKGCMKSQSNCFLNPKKVHRKEGSPACRFFKGL